MRDMIEAIFRLFHRLPSKPPPLINPTIEQLERRIEMLAKAGYPFASILDEFNALIRLTIQEALK